MTGKSGITQMITIDVLRRYYELRTWFEFDGEKLIGMSGKKTFDMDGNLVDYTEEPSGITITGDLSTFNSVTKP